MALTEIYGISGGLGGGTGVDEANAYDEADFALNIAAGDRGNWKGDGSFSSAITFANAGTAGSPIHIRGYVSTIGDQSGDRTNAGALDDAASMPEWLNSNGSGDSFNLPNYCHTSSINFKGTATGSPVLEPGNYNTVSNCRIENTDDGECVQNNSERTAFYNCDIVNNSSSTGDIVVLARGLMHGCRFTNPGGGAGVACAMNNVNAWVQYCQILDFDKVFSFQQGSFASIIGNSIRNCDEFFSAEDTTSNVFIAHNVIWGSNAAGSQAMAAASPTPQHWETNAIGNFADADDSHADWPEIGGIALTSDPFESSSDLRLNSTSGGGADCKNVGLWGTFNDLGAIQQAAGGGGGVASILGGGSMAGGFS